MAKGFALISGAAGGMGQAAARVFHTQGYDLWLTDFDAKGLAALKKTYPKARIDKVDLSQREALGKFCAEIEKSRPKLAYAFINAGIALPGAVTRTDAEILDRHIAINLTASMQLSRAVAIKMRRQGSGHIITTLSGAAVVALPGSAAYAASKFGMRGFMLSLAEELRGTGVAVSGLLPNAVDTPMLRHEALHGGSALNFLSQPSTTDDIAKALKRIMRTKKLETFVPASDRYLLKFLALFPTLTQRILPLFLKQGEKGRMKFIKKNGLKGTVKSENWRAN